MEDLIVERLEEVYGGGLITVKIIEYVEISKETGGQSRI
jgi:hypothetical protein